MTPEAIALVRASFATLVSRAERFAADFYARLFAQDPAAAFMFPADMESQGRKFVDMLGAIVEGLDQPGRLRETFASMGERHARYGVTEAHYDEVGVALLTGLRAALGEAYTEEVEEAWAEVYGQIAEAMIAAGRREVPA